MESQNCICLNESCAMTAQLACQRGGRNTQAAEDEGWCSPDFLLLQLGMLAHEMVLPMFTVSLQISANPIQKFKGMTLSYLHVSLDSVKLTINSLQHRQYWKKTLLCIYKEKVLRIENEHECG